MFDLRYVLSHPLILHLNLILNIFLGSKDAVMVKYDMNHSKFAKNREIIASFKINQKSKIKIQQFYNVCLLF